MEGLPGEQGQKPRAKSQEPRAKSQESVNNKEFLDTVIMGCV